MTHRVALLEAFGLDNLRLRERPTPEPGPGEARVRIKAVSLNRRDALVVEGTYAPTLRFPAIPCSDGAGVVEAVGPGCTRVKVGDRVVLHMFADWLSGEPTREKLTAGLGGPGAQGTLRESMVTPERALIVLPSDMSFETAACLPCAALTAWSALMSFEPVQPGDTVLTQGTGGVALFALQFARMAGARVIATTSSAEKAQRLRALGAHAVVNYRDDDWGAQVRKAADGRVDLIVEVGGAQTLDEALRIIRPGGTIAVVGVLSGAMAKINLPLALMRQVRMQGVTCGHRDGFEAMLRAIARHGVDPVIDSRFPLDRMRDAFARMGRNEHVGKIVIEL